MGSGYSRMLKPGESRSDICDVGVWYDLSQPGTYTIQARDGTALGQKAWVKSNAVTVTVVPAGTSVSESSRSPSQALGPPFSLTLWISPHVTGFKPGEVYVEVITENTSNHKLFLWTERLSTEQAGSVYKVDIHDSNGMSPPEMEFGRQTKIFDEAPPSAGPTSTPRQLGERMRLLPGESWRDLILMKNLYDLSQPGQYTIQVRRWDDETKTWVKSNTLTVTVTP